ncbi:hypothetical protein [Nonomuraea maritima]|nr:hypothetical protein [Nonomuraea maritima]
MAALPLPVPRRLKATKSPRENLMVPGAALSVRAKEARVAALQRAFS